MGLVPRGGETVLAFVLPLLRGFAANFAVVRIDPRRARLDGWCTTSRGRERRDGRIRNKWLLMRWPIAGRDIHGLAQVRLHRDPSLLFFPRELIEGAHVLASHVLSVHPDLYRQQVSVLQEIDVCTPTILLPERQARTIGKVIRVVIEVRIVDTGVAHEDILPRWTSAPPEV
jgi:hypothetical protein